MCNIIRYLAFQLVDRILKDWINMPLHPTISFTTGSAGFASWWSAVRVWMVGMSGEIMSRAIYKVVNSACR